MLAASVDDEQVSLTTHSLHLPKRRANRISIQAEAELSEIKSQAKMIFRRLSRNSAPQASIECGQYNLQYARSSYAEPIET